MAVMENVIFAHEKQKLKETHERYMEIIDEAKEFFKNIPALYPGDIDIVNAMLLETHNRIARLERGKDKPYFARIDFRCEGQAGDSEEYYIGKIGVVDAEENLVTLDWRAPAASLYYDSPLGNTEYASPGGMERVTLELKRLFEIEDGILKSCNDVDTVSNDDILRPYLGVNADNRLKNIVATIQAEQNRIIRESIDSNIIVQGAAGSGKTTVALHRIAYLAYNHRGKINPGQYMVIGPNRFFINYISSVLPDLEVDTVPQYTYQELAAGALDENITVNGRDDKLVLAAKGKYSAVVESYKTSMQYKHALDAFLDWYEQTMMPAGDFLIRGFMLFTADEISTAWQSARDGAGQNMTAKTEQCAAYLRVMLNAKRIEVDERLSTHFKALYAAREESLDKLHSDRAYIEKELSEGCATSLKAFMSGAGTKILPLYRLFVENAERYTDGFEETEALKKQTLANLRKKRVDTEDLAALLYLLERMRGPGEYKNFRHAVVDEAQDFGEFDFFAMQRLLSSCTFTVVGDIAQSVYSYGRIENWDSVIRNSFERSAKLLEMVKCYRTTIEVMECANKITAHLGLASAEPVIRSGEPVGFHKLSGKDAVQKILALVREYLDAGYKSVAILDKTGDGLKAIHAALTEAGIAAELITSNSEGYSGGVCLMPGYLAKGLEFDGVIITDASESVYSPLNRLDMHLLYVAMTRPLHRLEIISPPEGEQSSSLSIESLLFP